MKLAVFSDLHFEQDPAWSMPSTLPSFDVAVVAGDVHGSCRKAVMTLADMPALAGKPVVFVAGNHEHYRRLMQDNLADGLAATHGTNISLLDRRELTIEGVRFIGATLWTDYQLDGHDDYAMTLASRFMNDHALIGYRDKKGVADIFSPRDALDEHRKDLAFIKAALARRHNGPTVVVTHHLPSRRSVSSRYASSRLNPSFASDLDHVIEQHQPDLWVHGHTHSSCDYLIGRTRVVCNPKGYGPGGSAVLAENVNFDPQLVIEIGLRQRRGGVEL